MRISIILSCLMFSCTVFGQIRKLKDIILVDINNSRFDSYSEKDSTVIFLNNDGANGDMKVFNMKQKSFEFIFRTIRKDTMVTGKYAVIPKRIKGQYIGRYIGGRKKDRVIIFYYYNTKRIGTWYFHNQDNVLIKEIHY